MFIHRETGLKKTIDQNKFSIQCSSYCWQTRKESKYSYCQSSAWEVLKTEHWQPQTLLSIGTLLPQQEGQCREELRAAASSRAGKMSNSLQQTYSTALWPSALERPPAPTLLLASWVAFYNLAVAVSLLPPSLLWLPARLQSALTAGSARAATLTIWSQWAGPASCKDATIWGSQLKQWEYPTIQCNLLAICSTQCSPDSITVLQTPMNWDALLDGKELTHHQTLPCSGL